MTAKATILALLVMLGVTQNVAAQLAPGARCLTKMARNCKPGREVTVTKTDGTIFIGKFVKYDFSSQVMELTRFQSGQSIIETLSPGDASSLSIKRPRYAVTLLGGLLGTLTGLIVGVAVTYDMNPNDSKAQALGLLSVGGGLVSGIIVGSVLARSWSGDWVVKCN
jgi:hypothetical protein